MASGLAQGALVRTPRIHGPCCRLVLLDLPATRSGLGVRIGRAFRSHHLAHLTSGRQGYAVLVSSEVTSLDLSAWLTSATPPPPPAGSSSGAPPSVSRRKVAGGAADGSFRVLASDLKLQYSRPRSLARLPSGAIVIPSFYLTARPLGARAKR
jgi:hypothetical protein